MKTITHPNRKWFPSRSCKASDMFLLSGDKLQCGNCGAIED